MGKQITFFIFYFLQGFASYYKGMQVFTRDYKGVQGITGEYKGGNPKTRKPESGMRNRNPESQAVSAERYSHDDRQIPR